MLRLFKLTIVCVLAFGLKTTLIAGQSKAYYLVYWQSSDVRTLQALQLSSTSIHKRQQAQIPFQVNDYGIDSKHLEILHQYPWLSIHGHSRWLNASMIICDSNTYLANLLKHEEILKIDYMGRLAFKQKPNYQAHSIHDSFLYKAHELDALKQRYRIQAAGLQTFGANDKAYKVLNTSLNHCFLLNHQAYIAVLDAGFYNAYQIKGNEDLLINKPFIRDYVDQDGSVWEDDAHGANVLALMKSFDPNHYMGSSPFAQYALFRTECTSYESPLEAFNWLLAAETADSLGCDAIVSSLGYNQFDDKDLGLSYKQLDGHSSLAAFAANTAVNKGILVIVSAGNDGDTKWHYISTPGDASEAITVGSCSNQFKHSGFSAFGPNASGQVKPDLLAPGQSIVLSTTWGYKMGNGTSYATPILAGLLCNLWQLQKQLSPQEADIKAFKSLVLGTANQWTNPDSAYGYGIPDISLAEHIIAKEPYAFGLWPNVNGPATQSLNLHFYALKQQKLTLRIELFDKQRKCIKHIQKKINCSKDTWYHFDEAMRVYETAKTKSKTIDSMTIVIESEQGSYLRTLDF